MSAVAVKKPTQRDLLRLVTSAADLESNPNAKQAAERLDASFWTEEQRAAGRKLGQEKVEQNAIERREWWREMAIRAIVDNYHSGQYLRRKGLVDNLHTDSRAYGLKGKGGASIKKSTISGWLTEEVEEEIRLAAIARIVAEKLELARLK